MPVLKWLKDDSTSWHEMKLLVTSNLSNCQQKVENQLKKTSGPLRSPEITGRKTEQRQHLGFLGVSFYSLALLRAHGLTTNPSTSFASPDLRVRWPWGPHREAAGELRKRPRPHIKERRWWVSPQMLGRTSRDGQWAAQVVARITGSRQTDRHTYTAKKVMEHLTQGNWP